MTLENPSQGSQTGRALTPTEQQVANLWHEIIQSDVQPAPSDNFFSLGGDSLAMTLVLFRVQEVFGVELATASLMEAPELGAFASLIDSALLRGDQGVESGAL